VGDQIAAEAVPVPEVRSKVGGWPLAAAIAAVLVFLFLVREVLLPFILAAAIAFILTPAIDHVEQRLKIRRWIVAVVVYLLFLAFFGSLGYWVGGVIIRDLVQIVRQFPQLLHKLLADAVHMLSGMIGQSIDINALTKEVMTTLGTIFGGGMGLKFAGYGVAGIFGTILMLVLLIYFLLSGKQVAAGVFWLVPPEYRPGVERVRAKVLPMLWRYFVGLVAVIAYTTALAWVGFYLVFHIPHAPMLSIAVGLLELIPVIGPAVSLVLVGLSAMQQTTVLTMVGLAAFAIALRLSIDQIVGPLVLGRAAQLHPVVIIFAFLTGAALFGIIGLLLAVPLAAAIKIVLTMYYAEPVQNRTPPARVVSKRY
jgi:predicted PurR-regulated permease PerM